MEPLLNQVCTFATTLVIGMVAGFCYDYYRVVRGVFKLKKVGTHLGDAIFWLATTALVSFLLLLGNWGVVRLYVFIALGLGALIYFQLFGDIVRRLLRFKFHLFHELWKLTVKVTLFLWRIILFPGRLVILILSYPLNFLRGLFEKAVSWFKRIFYNLLGKRVEQGIIKLKSKLPYLVFLKRKKK